jgi:fatty-acyl-CoA synthase
MEIPLTPLDFLERARRLFPQRVGVVSGRERFSYADYAGRCHRMAHALVGEYGVVPGDRVAWLAGNTHELLEAYYGVLLTGAVLVPLNVRLARAEIEVILDDCSPRLLVRQPGRVEPGGGGARAELGNEWEALLSRQPEGLFEPPAVRESDPAEIFYTSGSTGAPKGAVLTHRALYLHAIHSALTNGVGPDDVVLHTIPLFHVNGWGTPHYVTALGGVHVMLPEFDPARVLELVEEEGVTRLFLVPTMASALLAEPGLAERDLSSVRQISVGGAPASRELLGALEDRFGCHAICGYGMTETAPTLTRSLDKPGETPSARRRATTGLPILGVDLRVMDDDDREVAWDGETQGEVCARSNHVMEGYWRAPEASADALRGGWMRTGDVGVVDADGYLRLVDRKKDLIISGGENISSVEVERALLAHEAVAEAAVVGVADPKWGEVPRAFVTLQAGVEVDGATLREFVRGRLAHFKAPREVLIVEALPVGGTGKVQKQRLREWS